MSQFTPYDFLAALNNGTENSPDLGAKDIKEELDLWSSAQFTFDTNSFQSNLMNQNTFDSFNLMNMQTPAGTPNLSQAALSPMFNFFGDNTGGGFSSLMSPHPSFPVSTLNAPVEQQVQQPLIPNNSFTPIIADISPTTPAVAPVTSTPTSTATTPKIGTISRKSSIKAPNKISSSENVEEESAYDKAAAEEDKRRRNTAASARFRIKKKLREQTLEKTAKEMTAKAEIMEGKVKELEMEIKWLRGLLLEKNPSLLEHPPSFKKQKIEKPSEDVKSSA
ncbi:hypothetical protein K493DRAFT_335409 [Basidiobolus meristosporus CBS 931.73]|uniref:BZIP domain-containing protein n=1 Tax=Basidiobolus meristosporus CBS 931.73 TaxID=1314790 RepID=A0A1Y1YQL4_9FUNG|nr:hypothetical protein K493DRAFT_335409 [Basidiobolus meristosporus CBS 931.73]|eukprot:ORY00269.1 hypothetical protein K493DRAFT_335409 [Basidiobolus meristosporus CBS 931.73]